MENEDLTTVRLANVQDQFTQHCYYILKAANESKVPLDAKMFDTIARFMEKTGIRDSEGPTLSPELLEASRQAAKLAKKRQEG